MFVSRQKYEHFVEFLETARKTLGINKAEMSEQIGIARPCYSEITLFRYPLNMATLIRLKYKVLGLIKDYAREQIQKHKSKWI